MIGTPEAAKQLRRYLEENILYDCYMAQPAWIAHMFCYEYLAEQMATLLGLIEIFYDSEKAKEFRDTAKMLTSRAEDIQANSNAMINISKLKSSINSTGICLMMSSRPSEDYCLMKQRR